MTGHISENQRDMPSFGDECLFCRENLEAEALGILELAEHARIQRHLQWCGPCRREVADLRQVVDLLPLDADIATPSPMVKARLFQEIADNAVSQATVNFGNPWSQSVNPEPVTPSSVPQPATPHWRTWLSAALLAPLAIALIVLGAWSNSMRHDLDSMRTTQASQGQPEVAYTTGGDIQLFSMEPSCPECDESPASGHLGGNPDDNVGILVAWNLDPGQKHQVWCEKRDGELLMISDLDVEHTGQVAQMLNFPDAIGGYATIYVTRHDGTEEMRVALTEDFPGNDSTPGTPISN